MNYLRLSASLAVAGVAALLSGCVVAPLGPRAGYYGSQPVYVEPAVAPVVVVPAPRYYGGGYYRGGRYWR